MRAVVLGCAEGREYGVVSSLFSWGLSQDGDRTGRVFKGPRCVYVPVLVTRGRGEVAWSAGKGALVLGVMMGVDVMLQKRRLKEKEEEEGPGRRTRRGEARVGRTVT